MYKKLYEEEHKRHISNSLETEAAPGSVSAHLVIFLLFGRELFDQEHWYFKCI